MRIHYLQHVPFENLANIAVWAQEKGHSVTCTKLYEDGKLPENHEYDFLIIMGGPMNIYEHRNYPWLVKEKKFIERAVKDNKTLLGICLGSQLIADALGGKVYQNQFKEIGWLPVALTEEAESLGKAYSLPKQFVAYHWHGDTFDIPAGCTRLASSEACLNQAFEYNERVIGLQFHLESTPDSMMNLIANCSDELVDDKYIQQADYMLAQNNYFKENKKYLYDLLNALEKLSK